jgi:dTDP-4-amino-4,6-dideoxygalactose transaminase
MNTETVQELPDTMDKVAYLQALAERLTTVLAEETACLRQQDMETFAMIQEGKQKLVKAYEETLRELQQTPVLLVTLTDTPKQTLKQVLAMLQQVMTENRTALKAARDSRRYVLKAMREAALEQTRELSAYGQKGNTQHAVFRRTPSVAAAAVAYNQQL